MKNWLTGKDPDAGKDWRQKRSGQESMRWLDGSLTWWTWVWTGSGSRWWRGKSGVLQSMGWQRVGRDWATELNWILSHCYKFTKNGWSDLITSQGSSALMETCHFCYWPFISSHAARDLILLHRIHFTHWILSAKIAVRITLGKRNSSYPDLGYDEATMKVWELTPTLSQCWDQHEH